MTNIRITDFWKNQPLFVLPGTKPRLWQTNILTIYTIEEDDKVLADDYCMNLAHWKAQRMTEPSMLRNEEDILQRHMKNDWR